MTSSQGYQFQPTIDEIVTDAFERCGIEPSDISAQRWDSSLFSFNGVLTELTNLQLNLWEVEKVILSLTEGVRDYQLPDGTIDCTEVYRRSFTRQLGGTATSSAGGTAQNAFDGDTATVCTQVSLNGNISYNYGTGTTQVITMVGYQSGNTASLALVWEGSNDASAWTSLLSLPAQTYTKGAIVWNVVPYPGAYQYYRVRATSGGTLNPEEVYFANGEKDYVLGRLSRQSYDAIATKTNEGTPTSFYVERVITPVLHLYQTPDDTFTMLCINRIRQIYSVTGATETVDAAARFVEAITAMLAKKLSVKYATERFQLLKSEAESSLGNAQMEDRERVKGKFVPNMSGYRIN